MLSCAHPSPVGSLVLLSALLVAPFTPARAQVSFTASDLAGETVHNPTSLQFGPDDRLYVLRKNGSIDVLTVVRNGPNDYQVTTTEFIDLVKEIPNHDDDGQPNPGERKRQATGLLVAGTAANPVLYVGSSDPRVGAGGGATDSGLDTNSGVISRLTWNGSAWDKVDLVRGLPRSEENHANNGMQLSADGTVLYIAQGGHTNAGAPSNNFAFATEYALAAAILSVDLVAIDALPTQTDAEGVDYKYDIPTLDDPTRTNANGIDDPAAPGYDGIDTVDPWGGNDGLNQAIIVPGGPVQVYSPGWRNAYDFLITKAPGREGRMYTIDNGANGGWGGHPAGEADFPVDPGGDPTGACTNEYLAGEPGSTGPGTGGDPKVNNLDNLHLITGPGYYGGHPHPVRGNPSGAGLYTYDTTGVWRTDPADLPPNWPPVQTANPVECDFRNPGETDGALYTWTNSTNGLAEYTASDFGGALQGDLLAASFDGSLYRVELNAAGDAVTNVSTFASNFGDVPLDVIAQGDADIFPGTVWAVTFIGDNITIFEPSTGGGGCTGADDPGLDEDSDGYDNADEIDNATDPCSAASKPADFDGDLTSDLNDPDDDDDGVLDTQDAFARDPDNGLTTSLPIDYPFFNGIPGTGFFGLGFTGLMTDGATDYLDLFDPDHMIAGGTAGLLTIDGVTAGDAAGSANTQEDALQFGLAVDASTLPFTVKVRLLSPFFDGAVPTGGQAQGAYLGTGDQDHFLRLALTANGGDGGFDVLLEDSGSAVSSATYGDTETGAFFIPDDVLAANDIDLFFSVDPAAGTVQPRYAVDGGPATDLGPPLALTGSLLNAVQNAGTALAVGVISTSTGGVPFTATWDFIEATFDLAGGDGLWTTVASANDPTGRHESAFAQAGDQLYLLGGRGNRKTQVYDPATATWSNGTRPPIQLHHFQAVEYDGLLYAVGAYTGSFPTEDLVPVIYLYDPSTHTWHEGPAIPVARQRGSAAAVAHNGLIYLVGGSVGGHGNNGVRNGWFDAYDPATNTWTTLPDAPHPRDHAQAAVVAGKLYLAGGRDGGIGDSVTEIDVYDFATGQWSSLPSPALDLPTPRSAVMVAALGSELLVIGGESDAQTLAHNETEAFDVTAQTWRSLAPLVEGRHGTQAIVANGGVYVVAGSGETGGAPELTSQEAFYFGAPTSPGGTPLAQGSLFHAQETLDFGAVPVGDAATQTITLSNTGGNQAVLVTTVSFSGDPDFALAPSVGVPFIVAPGGSVDVDVVFTPAAETSSTGQLVVSHTGANGPLTTSLSGNGIPATPLFRVNAGGKVVADTDLDWGKDTKNAPSPYNNAATGDNKTTRDTSTPIANTTGAPDDLFTHYRWDPSSAPEMQWSFPVDPGSYELRLYFAELDDPLSAVGARVFDVAVEGAVVIDDLDVFAEVGANTALVRTVAVAVSDDTLDIEFRHEVDHPFVTAIEVRPAGAVPVPPHLAASPDSLDFGTQAVASTSVPRSVVLSNTGGSALDVTGVTITGVDSSDFATSFAVPVTLAAGDTLSLGVTFTPPDEGTKTAQLVLTHTGDNSPLSVGLTGEGVTPSPSMLTASSDSLDFNVVSVGSMVTRTLTLSNTGGTEDVTVTALTLTGDSTFAFTSMPTLPLTVAAAGSADLVLAFSPDSTGAQTGQLTVEHSGTNGPLAVALIGEGVQSLAPLFRVNAGGKVVADTDLDWGKDSKGAPSPYSNAATGGDNNTDRDTVNPITNTTAAPDGLFTHYRWDPSSVPEMRWAFPVAPGSYELRLYFAELDEALFAVGARVFDVAVEGAVVLDDYDVFAAVGAWAALEAVLMVAVSDDTLEVEFLHEVQHPFLSGIEVRPAGGPAARPAGTLVAAEPGKVGDPLSRAESLPTVFGLAPNYPNPFQSETTIPYQVPEPVQVRLTVYNLLGQEVAVLVDGLVEPGVYRARLSARSLASGVYLYRMEAGDYVRTRRLVLTR